jgi:uncharacterized protein YuzE
MSNHSAHARFVDSVLEIRFNDQPYERFTNIKCVVDQDRLGDVIGVEILDIRRQTGGAVIESRTVTQDFRWSYDSEIDALYVHITRGSAPVQRDAIGRACIAGDGTLAAIEVQV